MDGFLIPSMLICGQFLSNLHQFLKNLKNPHPNITAWGKGGHRGRKQHQGVLTSYIQTTKFNSIPFHSIQDNYSLTCYDNKLTHPYQLLNLLEILR